MSTTPWELTVEPDGVAIVPPAVLAQAGIGPGAQLLAVPEEGRVVLVRWEDFARSVGLE